MSIPWEVRIGLLPHCSLRDAIIFDWTYNPRKREDKEDKNDDEDYDEEENGRACWGRAACMVKSS